MPKPERIVEAALFSAGRPVSVEELQEATGLDSAVIRDALRKLIRSSKSRDTAIEVAKAGARYCMQVRKELVPAVTKLAKTDIPRRLLKTLALIAYHQPIKQSALLEMVGPKVYDHVKELHRLGMILESPSGQTKILSTSSRFPEYFGIKTTKREEIKKWMAEIVGIKTDGTLVGVRPAPEILATPAPAAAGGGAGEGAVGEGGGAGEPGTEKPPEGAAGGAEAGIEEGEGAREPGVEKIPEGEEESKKSAPGARKEGPDGGAGGEEGGEKGAPAGRQKERPAGGTGGDAGGRASEAAGRRVEGPEGGAGAEGAGRRKGGAAQEEE